MTLHDLKNIAFLLNRIKNTAMDTQIRKDIESIETLLDMVYKKEKKK